MDNYEYLLQSLVKLKGVGKKTTEILKSNNKCNSKEILFSKN